MIGFISRLISGMIVLGITAFFTPGFRIRSLWALLLASIVLSGLDYLLSGTLSNCSSTGRGLSGFLTATVIIYVTKFFVPGYNVSIVGALIGAFIYGIVSAVIPVNQYNQ